MGRRQVAEAANAALKGAFVDLGRKFFRVLGLAKVTLLLGFTIAGYNQDRARSFLARRRRLEGLLAESKPIRRRTKRRVGTWNDLLGAASTPDTGARDPVPRGSPD